MKGDVSRPLVATISYRRLCRTMHGVTHRFWPVRGKPGLSVCLCCGCDQWLPRIKAWPVWKQRPSAVVADRAIGAVTLRVAPPAVDPS